MIYRIVPPIVEQYELLPLDVMVSEIVGFYNHCSIYCITLNCNSITNDFSKESYNTHTKSCNYIFYKKNQQCHLYSVNFRNYVLFLM